MLPRPGHLYLILSLTQAHFNPVKGPPLLHVALIQPAVHENTHSLINTPLTHIYTPPRGTLHTVTYSTPPSLALKTPHSAHKLTTHTRSTSCKHTLLKTTTNPYTRTHYIHTSLLTNTQQSPTLYCKVHTASHTYTTLLNKLSPLTQLPHLHNALSVPTDLLCRAAPYTQHDTHTSSAH